jgi:hypothetical protein
MQCGSVVLYLKMNVTTRNKEGREEEWKIGSKK